MLVRNGTGWPEMRRLHSSYMAPNLQPEDQLGDFTADRRILTLTAMAALIGVISAFVALARLRLIGLFTFYDPPMPSLLGSTELRGVGPSLWACRSPPPGRTPPECRKNALVWNDLSSRCGTPPAGRAAVRGSCDGGSLWYSRIAREGAGMVWVRRRCSGARHHRRTTITRATRSSLSTSE